MEVKKQRKKRIFFLDELRGFAIICMIVHHTFLDIGDVLYLDWGYEWFNKLCTIQPLFWAIFIIISGVCSRMSRNTIKRGAIVFGFAIIITFITAFIMPKLGFENAQIYFGILHCLGACMIITGLLMPIIKKINFKIGAIISAALFLFSYGISSKTLCFGLIKLPEILYQHDFLAPLGLFSSSFYSADYFSLIPWLFLFLFGAFIGQIAIDEKMPKWMYNKHSKFLSFVGKNSLWIYLAHQPVLYGIFFIISFIMLLY